MPFAFGVGGAGEARAADAAVRGWLNWRGPNQNGASDEKGLPEKISLEPGGENCLWVQDVAGNSTPVIANGKLFVVGYAGEGPDLREGIFCMDAETGKPLWNALFNDYLSDIIYSRYAITSPSIDAETGNVYFQGTQGLLACFTPDGKMLWHHWMMEEFGRLTFPNGRTASPVIDGELVITAGITANWGAHGPGGHRFYAFDKKSGELVWASQPGERPRESCYSTPVFGWYGTKRVFWSGGGDGCIYCVNARTGDPIWRYELSKSAVNPTVLAHGGTVIAVHGSENIFPPTDVSGRLVALRPPAELPAPPEPGKAAVLDDKAEVWRAGVCAYATSPVLAGNRVYAVSDTADLSCFDAQTGKPLWPKPLDLGIDERTASPVYGDGKLYVPLMDGTFYILKPGDTACEILDKHQLAGGCGGAPAIWKGRVYVQSTQKLYCFGKKQPGAEPPAPKEEAAPPPGPLAKFLAVPADMTLHPGQKQPLRLIGVDASGQWLKEPAPLKAAWEKFIPPTAKVKSMLNGAVVDGVFVADPVIAPSAGALRAQVGTIAGVTRGRILPGLPISQDFEKFELQPSETDPAVKFAYPPLPWIGARFKWEIRERDGNKCMVKTVDNKFFQRALTFVGSPELSGYTVQADVMSDGATRKVGGKEKVMKMSEVGLINQRYIVFLKGEAQRLEIGSNQERVQFFVPFEWKPNTWYTLKTRVDVDAATGVGVIRGKAWRKGEAEPEKWTIEMEHKTAHKQGSPGLFGFSPADMPVYVDHFSVTKN